MIHWHLPPIEEPRPVERVYREELAAAHARIAELEERIRLLTAAVGDPELHALELEQHRLVAEREASPRSIRKVIALFVVGALAWLIPRSTRRALRDAEKDLAAAVRLRQLERELRETNANGASNRVDCTSLSD
jgi:hypothetical protein